MTNQKISNVVLGRTDLDVSMIGLGCSRLGSTLNGGSREDAIGLIRHAFERGIRLFDTADIYGQGDSERLLGEALSAHRHDIVIVTKGGQRFTPAQRAAALLKKPIRAAASLIPSVKRAIAGRRAGRLPRDFSPDYLEQAVGRSLKRLRMDRLDVFLLHSPNLDEISGSHSFDRLTRLQERGLLRHWGVSCDDQDTVRAALANPTIGVLQVPLLECSPALLAQMHASRVGLLIREIFAQAPAEPTADWRRDRIEQAAVLPNAAVLVGTTRSRHLDQALDAVRYARIEALP